MMKLRSAALTLGLSLLAVAAVPLPPAVVPGEKPPADNNAVVADLLKRLGSSDPAIYNVAFDDCTEKTSRITAMLAEEAAKPGLDKTTKARLDAALVIAKPLRDANDAITKRMAGKFVCAEKLFLKAYDTGKHTNPKWDADARAAIGYQKHSDCIADIDFTDTFNFNTRAKFYLDRAVAAGCDDPALLMVDVWVNEYLGTKGADECFGLIQRADAADKAAPTAPYIKVILDGRILRHKGAFPLEPSVIKARLNDMVANLKLLEADPDFNSGTACDVAGWIDEAATLNHADIGEWFDKYEPSLEAAYPKESEVWMHRGKFYIAYAWVARGHGAGSTVTPAMGALFQKRLAIAREALEKSWSMDQHVYQVPVQMMSVVLGTGGSRDEMEKWFRRGVEISPTDDEIYRAKMIHLDPRWYGSNDEKIKFGRECLATELYRTKIPMLLVQTHLAIATKTTDPDAYLAQPEVWQDLSTAYDRTLLSDPKREGERFVYAELATRAGQWETANAQFKILGDIPPGRYPAAAMAQFEAYKEKAAAHQ